MPEDTQQLILELETKGASRAVRDINDLKKSAQENVETFERLGRAAGVDLADSVESVRDQFTELNNEQEALLDKYAEQSAGLEEAVTQLEAVQEAAKEGLIGEEAVERAAEVVEIRKDGLDDLSDQMEGLLDDERKAVQDLNDQRSQALEKMGQEVGSGFLDSIKSLRGADISGALEGAGGGLQGAGEAAAGMKGGGKMSNLIGKMGKFAGMLGAITAGLASVVSLLVDMEAQAKEFNTQMLEGTSLAKLMDQRFSDVETEVADAESMLREIRSAAMDFENFDYGMTPEDHAKILSNLEQQGALLRTLDKRVATMRGGWGGVTRDIQALSTVMGTSIQDTSELVGQLTQTTSDNINTVMEGMTETAHAFTTAEMASKDFFGALQQISGTLSMYNFRLEETANLLSQTSEYMDPENAKEFTQAMTTGFTDMGLGELAKMKTVAGPGAVEDALRVELQNLTNRLGEGQQEAVSEALGSMGLEGGAENLGATLRDMTGQERREFISSLRTMGMDELAQSMTKTSMMLDDMQGTELEQLEAMRMLGSESQMAIRLRQLQNISQKEEESIRDLTDAQGERAGMNSKQLDQAQMFYEQLLGDFESLEKAAGNPTVDFSKRAEKLGLNVTQEEFQKMEGPLDLLGKRAKTEKDQRKTMRDLAKEQVDRTQSLTEAINRGVEYILNQMYGVLLDIYETISVEFLADEEEKSRLEKIRAERAAMEQRRNLRREMREAKKEGDKEEVERIKGEMKKSSARLKAARTMKPGTAVSLPGGGTVRGRELINMMAEYGVSDPAALQRAMQEETKAVQSVVASERSGVGGRLGAAAEAGAGIASGLPIDVRSARVQTAETIKGVTELGKYTPLGALSGQLGIRELGLEQVKKLDPREREKTMLAATHAGKKTLDEELKEPLKEGNLTQEKIKKAQEKMLDRMQSSTKGMHLSRETMKKLAEEMIKRRKQAALTEKLLKAGVDRGKAGQLARQAMMGKLPEDMPSGRRGKVEKAMKELNVKAAQDARIVTSGIPLLDLKRGDVVVDSEMLANTQTGRSGEMIPRSARAGGGGGGLTQHNTFHINGDNKEEIKRTILKTFEEWERKKVT